LTESLRVPAQLVLLAPRALLALPA
jgi:hypothetical protein